jgi:hypothetical protein
VGGVDSLALSTLFGFHSLELLSAPCRRSHRSRDGISIGEARASTLTRKTKPGAPSQYGEVPTHIMSSPSRGGLGGTMRKALSSAGLRARDRLHQSARPAVAERAEDREWCRRRKAASSTKDGPDTCSARRASLSGDQRPLAHRSMDTVRQRERVDPALPAPSIRRHAFAS